MSNTSYTSKHFPAITHGACMKCLGSGWQQIWCDGDWQRSPWRWGCVTGEEHLVCGITWAFVSVSQRGDSALECGNLHTASWTTSFWQINSQTWRSLTEFTVVRWRSGSAHVVSLGLVSTDSLRIPSHICAGKWEERHTKISVLSTYWINISAYWQNRMPSMAHSTCKTKKYCEGIFLT